MCACGAGPADSATHVRAEFTLPNEYTHTQREGACVWQQLGRWEDEGASRTFVSASVIASNNSLIVS